MDTAQGLACSLACGVSNADAVLDVDPDNFASATLTLAALSLLEELTLGDDALSLTVTLANPIDPTVPRNLNPLDPASPTVLADQPGFVVSFPDPTLLTASVLPLIRIATLAGGQVVGTPTEYGFGFFDSLAVGTPLQDINNARVYLGTPASANYDAIRIGFTGALADVLLSVDIHQVGIAGVPGSISGDIPSPAP